MSLSSYKRVNHVYYNVVWSYVDRFGEKHTFRRGTNGKTPEAALKETKDCILQSKLESFEARVSGIRFE